MRAGATQHQTGGAGALTVKGWRLYYGDGSTVDSRNTAWQQARNDNVQALIVFYNECYEIWEGAHLKSYPYSKVYCQQDYYWLYGAGTAEDARTQQHIKRGRLLKDDEWWALYDRIHNDLIF